MVLPSPSTSRVLKNLRACHAFFRPPARVQAVMKGYSPERPRGRALFTVQVGVPVGWRRPPPLFGRGGFGRDVYRATSSAWPLARGTP